MRQHHGFDEADAARERGGGQIGGAGEDGEEEEQGAETAFGEAEFTVQPVAYPGGGGEAGGEAVDGEEEAEFYDEGSGFWG